jgi:hypothetical protein
MANYELIFNSILNFGIANVSPNYRVTHTRL